MDTEKMPKSAVDTIIAAAQAWFVGEAPVLKSTLHSCSPILGYLDATLRGVGQVIFMNSPITGLFIVAGLLVADVYASLSGLLGSASATAFGILLEGGLTDPVQIGLYGFNGTNLRAAMSLIHDPGPI